MLLQCRHTSLSSGEVTVLRSGAFSEARNRVAALTNGSTLPPSRSLKRSSSTWPLAVMPRNGSFKELRQLANRSCNGLETWLSSMRDGARSFIGDDVSGMFRPLTCGAKPMKRAHGRHSPATLVTQAAAALAYREGLGEVVGETCSVS